MRKTVRYFPDKLPIGVERNFGPRHRVPVPGDTRDVPVDFRAFLIVTAELLRTLPEWTIRLLVPRRFRKAANLYRYAVRDELATPLDAVDGRGAQWFFPARHASPESVAAAPRIWTSPRPPGSTGAAPFQALHREWQRQGMPVLWSGPIAGPPGPSA